MVVCLFYTLGRLLEHGLLIGADDMAEAARLHATLLCCTLSARFCLVLSFFLAVTMYAYY